jgi:hypothetical protein
VSAGATLVLPASELELTDIDWPELIYLCDRDTQVLGSAPAEDWPRFQAGAPLRFEVDTEGDAMFVIDGAGSRLCEIQMAVHVRPGETFYLQPAWV